MEAAAYRAPPRRCPRTRTRFPAGPVVQASCVSARACGRVYTKQSANRVCPGAPILVEGGHPDRERHDSSKLPGTPGSVTFEPAENSGPFYESVTEDRLFSLFALSFHRGTNGEISDETTEQFWYTTRGCDYNGL